MSTTISDLYEPVRAFLGDFNSTVRKYQDASIADVIRSVVRCGRVPGITVGSGNLTLEPGLSTPLLFAQTVYHACLAFIGPNAASYSYRTRAIGESFGEQKDFIHELKTALYEIENGGASSFTGWVDFHSWAMSLTGVDLWAVMSEVKTNAPVATITVGRDGITVDEG